MERARLASTSTSISLNRRSPSLPLAIAMVTYRAGSCSASGRAATAAADQSLNFLSSRAISRLSEWSHAAQWTHVHARTDHRADQPNPTEKTLIFKYTYVVLGICAVAFPVSFALLRLYTTSDKNSICGVRIDDLRLFKSGWNLCSVRNTEPFITNGLFEALERAAGAVVATRLMNEPLIVKHEWSSGCFSAVCLKCFHSFLPGGHGRWPTFQNINAAFIWMFTFCPSVENAEARRWWSTGRRRAFCLSSSLLLILFYITQELNLLFSISVLTVLQLMLHRTVLVTPRCLNL